MKSNIIIMSLTVFVLSIMTGCATMETARHNYIMRGQVIEATSEGVYLCIGSADGAEVGQEFKVYRYIIMPSNKSLRPAHRRDETGLVKITEIVDEHYAKAMVVKGEAKVNSIVELK